MSVKMKEWCKDRHKENIGGTLHFCFDEFRSVNFWYGGGERDRESDGRNCSRKYRGVKR